MHTPSYLLKNSFGIYHLRLAVPKHLRHTVGKREIKKTLRTGNRREALRKARRLATQYQDWFDQMADFDDILNNPLNKQLEFESFTVKPDGTREAKGVKLDPDNLEADTAALEKLLGGVNQQTTTGKSSITLQELINEYLEAMQEDCNTKTLAGYTAHLGTFLDILGDVPINTITRKQARESVNTLKQLPPNRNKSPQFKGKTIGQILQMKPEPMSTTTARLYIERMSTLFDFAIKERHTDYNPYQGLKPKKATRPDQERKQFTSSDLAALFSPDNFKLVTDKPSRYWIPLLATYTGMRLEEICQLQTQDIQYPDNVPCIDINDAGDKQLKNTTATRVVPIHHSLIKLGFIKFASKQQGRLFPELTKANGKRGHHFSKWFARYRKQCDITEPGKTFHSFRHTVATAFKQADVEETKAAAILGHTVNGETYGRYGKEYRPEQLRQVIEMIDYSNAVP